MTQAGLASVFLWSVSLVRAADVRAAESGSIDRRWVVYYGDESGTGTAALKNYDLIVLDSDRHPPLSPLLALRRVVLGYLSLGEINKTRSYFEQVQKEGLLLAENAQWPGSYGVDVRDPRWTARVVEKLVPVILQQGFSGVFLDTVDRAAQWERSDPVKWRGMSAAVLRLVRTLRQHFPKMTIMVNRGYDLWPELLPYVDMVAAESLMTTYDFATAQYREMDEQEVRRHVDLLKSVQDTHKTVLTMTLDYWDIADTAGVARIYHAQRQRGFVPYVASIALDRVVVEPGFHGAR